MTIDLKITGGHIVDGSGGAGFTGDIGVKDGRIVEVGKVASPAKREIKADGALVTPGFVDMHTHYDAQATWDPELVMSSRHGVTTAIMGNCGVGCAPRRPGGEALLLSHLSGVEDIPIPVLDEAMTWEWESFGDYLDVLARTPRTIDVGAYLAHTPLRAYALGPERGGNREKATADELVTMRGIAREALRAGAIGITTGRIYNHRMEDGRLTPDFDAADEEILTLAAAIGDVPGRVMQIASDFHELKGIAGIDHDVSLIEQVARQGNCPVSLLMLQWPLLGVDGWRTLMTRFEALNAQGLDLRFEVPAKAIGLLMGLSLSIHPFLLHPSYQTLALLPLKERVARMRDPEVRASILAETAQPLSPNSNTNEMVASFMDLAGNVFRSSLANPYEPGPSDSVAAIAAARGQSVPEAYYDLILENEGTSFLYWPLRNYEQGSLDVTREMLMNPAALMSFGDGGAHATMICDSAYSTFAMRYWGKDRKEGIPMERIIRLMSGAQADHFGFADRGLLRPGRRADINIVDPADLRLQPPTLASDLPAGGQRLLQFANGYIATFVNGTAIVEQDSLTGARPGGLLRAA